jgi:ATP-dependent Clp protease adaptor protein ClpS
MLTAHAHGEAVVTVLPYQEASDKIYAAHEFARTNGFPLRFYLEPEGSR